MSSGTERAREKGRQGGAGGGGGKEERRKGGKEDVQYNKQNLTQGVRKNLNKDFPEFL